MRPQLLAATALTGTISFLVPGIAYAQPYDWSGFYLGIAGGLVHSDASIDFDGIDAVTGIPSSLELPALGADGTVRIGYNWQSGQFVYGTESDIGIVALHASHSGGSSSDGSNYTVTDSLNTLLSLRARFGLAFDRMMVFATAGVATGNASFVSDIGKGSSAGADGAVFGGVIGTGMEIALTDNVSFTATGLYYDLSPLQANGDAGIPGVASDPYSAIHHPRGTIFEAGLNFHF